MTNDANVWAVILAGGFGTRFWPASTRAVPKQFLKVAGTRSLIAETAHRLGALVPPERRIVVTANDHVALVRKHLRNLPSENVLAEPVGRNTAAAVAWAAVEIARRDPGSVHCVLPSDHVIQPAASFRRLLRAACDEALASDALTTFGIRPTFPATGYGYIEAGAQVATRGKDDVLAVERFVEKPDRARAEQFLASGRFYWNSGMFVWKTSAILAALRRHVPAVVGPLEKTRDAASIYPTLPSVSIDVGVMEKQSGVRVLPVDYTWSDVGAWPAIADVAPLDAEKNCAAGGATLMAEDARGNVVYGGKGETIALLGVSNLVVVRAGKTVMVCPIDRAQDVKKLAQRAEG